MNPDEITYPASMVHRSTRRPRRVLASIAFGLVLAGCGPGTSNRAPSAVLITLDTTRADALACYGTAGGSTPALDRLATEGVRFESAYAVAPLTLPSHASMLTGLYPPRHTLRNNGIGALPGAADSVAELARASGRQTAAFVAAAVLDQAFGLDQGFEVYDAPRRVVHKSTVDYEERAATEVVGAAAVWLRQRDRTRPFFLWVHLFDPHGPHEVAPGPEGLRAGYLRGVEAADRGIGRLMDALRREDALAATTVLVVGDHGEALGEHDEPTHGLTCYESALRVPMILRRSDGERAGTRETGVVSVVDVHPTLLEALGLSRSPDLDGISLYSAHVPPERGAYFESYYGYLSYGWSPITGWVEATGKYLHSSEPEYYDVARDPEEVRNLLDDRPDEVERLRASIRSVASRGALRRETSATDPALLEQVHALGYAESRTPEDDLPGLLDDVTLPSPRRMAEEDRTFRQAETQVLAGKELGTAEASLRAILGTNPRHYLARDVLGTCLILQNRFAEALAILEAAPGIEATANTHVNKAICLIRLGRDEDALVPLRRALEVDPGHLKALGNLVFTLEKLGRAAEAEPHRRSFRERSGEELPRRK